MKETLQQLLDENPSGLLVCFHMFWRSQRVILKEKKDIENLCKYLDPKVKSVYVSPADKRLVLKAQLYLTDLEVFENEHSKTFFYKMPKNNNNMFLLEIENIWDWYEEHKGQLVEIYYEDASELYIDKYPYCVQV